MPRVRTSGRQLVAFTADRARRIRKNAGGVSNGVLPVDTRPRGATAAIFQYVLTSRWNVGEATADIYFSDGAGDGNLVAEDAEIYDPVRQSILTDQVEGDVGWCHKQGNGYYAWQGPCAGSTSSSGGGTSGGDQIPDPEIEPDTLVVTNSI